MWYSCIIPVLKGQCLFAGAPMTLGHAIRESKGYLPFAGTQLPEMQELRGFGMEKSDMCKLFVNVHVLSVVSLLKNGACTQVLLAPEFAMNETDWCLPPRLPNSQQQPDWHLWLGRRWFPCQQKLCTKLIWANCTDLGVVGWWVLPNKELRQPNGGSGVGSQSQQQELSEPRNWQMARSAETVCN